MFFYKECKRTQRTERSFEKNGCPTLTQWEANSQLINPCLGKQLWTKFPQSTPCLAQARDAMLFWRRAPSSDHVKRKHVWKLLHWDYWPKTQKEFETNLTQWWNDAEMPSQNNLILKRHGYAIMSEGVFGFDLGGPSCCLSDKRQKTIKCCL